ncbi:methyltransferase domain-containing protein [Thiomicrorhabdus sp. zzn3]|uniref:methyltransferase n=1 Tax=Thiomicrorhabdus sp. zzn3 TaxID=3039775 RepID=UPI002436E9AD|nr:methyltransferase [Thiomicrorhabdus sp. zzn3]MDG6778804.1 methyltransferase domain-containing protein [Thiomicrorhabdus sp. zzn3]
MTDSKKPITPPKPTAKRLQDRNFDKLVDKFEAKIYNTVKGEWRLKLLKEDLQALRDGVEPQQQSQPNVSGLVKPPLQVWDAGCGFAQVSQWLAEAGHQITLCDLSYQMLLRAQREFAEAGLHGQFVHGAAQDLAPTLPQFDLVLFHAVLEWLAQPQETLNTVAEKVKPGGHLSLLFYNRNSVVIRNTLRGGWRLPYILHDDYIGKGKKLTPPNPQIPEEVAQWLEAWGFKVEIHTGIRVFHDYMTHEVLEQSDIDDLLALEYRFCRQPTYRNMARYIHLLAKKNEPTDSE